VGPFGRILSKFGICVVVARSTHDRHPLTRDLSQVLFVLLTDNVTVQDNLKYDQKMTATGQIRQHACHFCRSMKESRNDRASEFVVTSRRFRLIYLNERVARALFVPSD